MTIYTSKINAQRGIGLIEVLIAAVVIAVGLMSLASLQGELMHSSGESKARSEAVKLAEEKLEEFRNNISKSDFDLDLGAGTGNDSINGSNATFARSWTLTDATSPDRKNIAVNVTWGGASADETVNMVSEVVWSDPGKATDYATDGNGLAGKAPSPNNNSSIVSNTKFKSDEISEASMDDGSGLSKYIDENGDIYLLKTIDADADGNDRQAVIKFQGGVILSIKGAVYLGNVPTGQNPTPTLTPTTTYPVAFSDLAYCVFPVPGTSSDYICYFGGDCAQGGNGCPEDIDDFKAVQGGWYGKVGLTETSSANFHNKKVCFGEDVAGTGIETAATTARTYITRRVNASNNVIGSEGINQSFDCQNFLIVDKRGSSYPCSSFSDFTIPNTNNKLAIASSSMERVLSSGQPNVVLAEDSSQCGATSKHIVTGTITGDQRDKVSVLIDRNACLISVANNVYTYICTIETTNANVTITAYGGSVSPATQSIALSGPQLTGPTLSTDGDSNCVAPWGASVSNGGSVTAYQTASVPEGSCASEQRVCTNGTLSGSYVFESCSVQASGDCITPWGAIIGNGSTVTAYQNETVNSPETCDGVSELRACVDGNLSGSFTNPSCSVGQAPSQCSVTIAGNILKGSGSTAQPSSGDVTVTATPGGSCVKASASGNTYSYSCSVGTLATGSSVAISGTKVTGGGSVTVDCVDQDSVTINGPNLTTTN
jgi:type IV pilus modification protein PilV